MALPLSNCMQGLRHSGEKQPTVKRLSEKSADTLGSALVRDFVPPGHEKHGKIRSCGARSIPEFKAIDAGQPDVGDQNIDV
jgi:hypothetical protein